MSSAIQALVGLTELEGCRISHRGYRQGWTIPLAFQLFATIFDFRASGTSRPLLDFASFPAVFHWLQLLLKTAVFGPVIVM
jgi:hypothetical protein